MTEKLKKALDNTQKIWICKDCINTPTFEIQKEAVKHHIQEHQEGGAE